MTWVKKWPLEKTPEYFNINRSNKGSTNADINNLGWFQILAELCCDFCSLNDASHHKTFESKTFYVRVRQDQVLPSSILWDQTLYLSYQFTKKVLLHWPQFLKQNRKIRSQEANVIKLFTAVKCSHSMVTLSFCVLKLNYIGNYHGMAVNYQGIASKHWPKIKLYLILW